MAEDTRLPPPEDLRAAIEQSQSIGMALYHHDLVSAIGTDVMLANVRAPKELGIAGYLSFQDADEDGRPLDRWQVTFFSAGDPPSALCRVRVPMQPSATPEFASIDPPTRMSDDAQRLIRARRAVLAAIEPSVQAVRARSTSFGQSTARALSATPFTRRLELFTRAELQELPCLVTRE